MPGWVRAGERPQPTKAPLLVHRAGLPLSGSQNPDHGLGELEMRVPLHGACRCAWKSWE